MGMFIIGCDNQFAVPYPAHPSSLVPSWCHKTAHPFSTFLVPQGRPSFWHLLSATRPPIHPHTPIRQLLIHHPNYSYAHPPTPITHSPTHPPQLLICALSATHPPLTSCLLLPPLQEAACHQLTLLLNGTVVLLLHRGLLPRPLGCRSETLLVSLADLQLRVLSLCVGQQDLERVATIIQSMVERRVGAGTGDMSGCDV